MPRLVWKHWRYFASSHAWYPSVTTTLILILKQSRLRHSSGARELEQQRHRVSRRLSPIYLPLHSDIILSYSSIHHYRHVQFCIVGSWENTYVIKSCTFRAGFNWPSVLFPASITLPHVRWGVPPYPLHWCWIMDQLIDALAIIHQSRLWLARANKPEQNKIYLQ